MKNVRLSGLAILLVSVLFALTACFEEGNNLVTASFSFTPTTPQVGEKISFDASKSSASGAKIASYAWDFGDGTTGSGVTITHVYNSEGSYKVTLTVKDDRGASNSATKTISVKNPQRNEPPVPKATASQTAAETLEPVTFDASESYDPDGVIVSYAWNFGDGQNGNGVIITHAYRSFGSYLVTLTVSDDKGAAAQATITIRVRAPVEIYELLPWPYGPEPDREYITLHNKGGTIVDISGWILTDEEGSYVFPAGTRIEPGGFLKVTGHSYNSAGDLRGLFLSNKGDTVILKSAEGEEICRCSYSKASKGKAIRCQDLQ